MTSDNKKHTILWADKPLAELFRLAWPIAVSWISYSVMTLVDTLFVARLGASCLAGVGLAGIFLWVLICFPFGLLQGAKVLVSQAVGAGRREQVGAYLGAALVWALGLSLMLELLAEPAAALLPALSATPAAGIAAGEYFRIRLIGVPLFLTFCALREVRQGLGDSRSPMKASVTANIANIALDYLLIIVLGMGVAGAAWATVAARLIEVSMLLSVQRRAGFQLRLSRCIHLWALWRIGWPTGLQFIIEMACFSLLSVMISRYSEAEMAAHQIAIQVIHLSFLPAFAIGEAASVLAGQAVGARREDLVRPVARLALIAAGSYTGFCALVLALGRTAIAGAFTDDPALCAITVKLLTVAAVFQVFDGANIISRSVLRGTGDVRYPAVVGTVAAWMLTPPAMWLLGYRLGMGALGGWIGLCAELMLTAALFWLRLERGGWRAATAQAREIRQDASSAP